MQSLPNTRMVCASRCRSRRAKLRGNGCGRGWGRAWAALPAPRGGPEVLLNTTSAFLPKAKRLGNAMQKVTHTVWDFTMAGHHQAPGPRASAAQVGGLRSCLQMRESLPFGGHRRDNTVTSSPLGGARHPTEHPQHPLPALPANLHQLACPPPPGVPPPHRRPPAPHRRPPAPHTASPQAPASAVPGCRRSLITLARTLVSAGRPSPPDFAICRALEAACRARAPARAPICSSLGGADSPARESEP